MTDGFWASKFFKKKDEEEEEEDESENVTVKQSNMTNTYQFLGSLELEALAIKKWLSTKFECCGSFFEPQHPNFLKSHIL